MIKTKKVQKSVLNLTKSGKEFIEQGTPEFRLFNHIPDDGINLKELKQQHKNLAKFGFKNGISKKWFKIDKGHVTKNVENSVDEDKELLVKI